MVTSEEKNDPPATTGARTVVVTHRTGLHARPCLAIVNTARKFRSKAQIQSGAKKANAGEILEILCLGAEGGTEVTLTATGPDANEALDALVRLFETNFGFDD
ncbi:MAG TPA: HPr family phosphocarrier protein [Thermoguttaceae bacterium]|nr:HPr family phosphocarrier protein [Thermoguttaceae bacterium]